MTLGRSRFFTPASTLCARSSGELAADRFDELRGFFVQMRVGRVRGDLVEVAGDGADVFGDRPLVVVEHDDELLGRLGDVVERFVGDAAGEGGVAGDADDVLVRAAQVAPHGHAERGADAVPAWPAP